MTDLLTVLPVLYNDFNFQRGIIQGLQEQNSTSSPCYTNTIKLQETAVSSKAQLDFLSYGSATVNKGNTPTDVGFAISIYEFFVDFGLVGFNFYTYCTFELLLISLSNIFSKSSTAFSFVSNVSIQLLSLCPKGSGFCDTINSEPEILPLYNLD